MPKYTYNGVACEATRRRPSSRDDKKYMRTVTYQGGTRLVHYGDPNMEMQRDIPERREAFLARHQCDTKKDPFAPGFWACLDWQRTDEKSMDVKADLFDVSQDEHNGVMVAWFPPTHLAQQIAAREGVTVEADQLHVTLCYLGKADDMSDEQIASLILVLRDFFEDHSETLSGILGGVGVFNASESSDGQDVIYANVDVPGLSRLRHILASHLRGYADISEGHDYTPHMTLGYVELGTGRALPEWETIDIELDAFALTVGDKRHMYRNYFLLRNTADEDAGKSLTSDGLVSFGDTVKAHIKNGQGVVEALGLRYSDHTEKDLEEDYFTAKTDYGPHQGNGMAATLNHRMPMMTRSTTKREAEFLTNLARQTFKNPVKAIAGDYGILVQHVLDLSDEYERTVFELAQNGKFRWSSGAASHMVDRGRDGEIKMWHIAEWAYTPIAAEPRLPAIAPVKSLANITLSAGILPDDINDSSEVPEASMPEGDGTSPVQDASAGSSESTANDNELEAGHKSAATGDFTMNEELEEQGNETPAVSVAPAVDTSAIVSAVTTALDERMTKSLKAFEDRLKKIEEEPVNVAPVQVETKSVNINKNGTGDTWTKAYLAFLRKGDDGGLKHLKASNDTDMNIGTAADGGYAVPTGHYQGIIARRDEGMLARSLGVMNIPGKGLTVNVPLDAEADGEFVSTAEAAAFDRDAPALGQAAMTLVKYSKKIELSYELLNDEDSRLMAFLEDFVGRGMAKTHNSLLLTEILANGTASVTAAATGAITAGEVMDLEYALADEYTDNAAWIMRRATEGVIRKLQGSDFLFQNTPAGQGDNAARREINGYPVYNSQSVPAVGASAKTIAFVNGNFIGMREEPEITFLRDPYSKAGTGQVVLHYYFRTVYKVLQAEAVHYLTQAAS